mgnify:CR=1 FL=1
MLCAHYGKPVILLIDEYDVPLANVSEKGYYADTGLASHGAEMKEWYDGYYFGGFDVYCPWDVMKHVKNLILNPKTKPDSHWKNCKNDLSYENLHSSEENLWGVLYLTGYLTQAKTDEIEKELPPGCMALRIPNTEIKEIFDSMIKKWFEESTRK